MANPTREEKIKELKREVAFRQRVYPQMIRRGTLSLVDAHRRQHIMNEILADYLREGDLFAIKDGDTFIPNR